MTNCLFHFLRGLMVTNDNFGINLWNLKPQRMSMRTLFVSKIVLWNTLPENLSCQCPVLYLLYWRPHPASKIRVVEGGSRGCCLPPNELCLLLGNPEISKQPKTFTSQKVIAFYNLVVKFILQCFNRKLWVIIRLASMHQMTLQEYVLLFILPF